MTGIEWGHITISIPSDIWPIMKAGYETATGVLSPESHTFATTNFVENVQQTGSRPVHHFIGNLLSLRFASNLAAFLSLMPCTYWRAVPLRKAGT
jgi:hypothetical protein